MHWDEEPRKKPLDIQCRLNQSNPRFRINMSPTAQTNDSTAKPSADAQPIKVGIMPLFSTWVYRCESGPVHLNEKLEGLAHKLMEDDRNATRRTNFGGWHYAFDFFELQDPLVAEFREIMEQHVQAFLNHFRPEGRKK